MVAVSADEQLMSERDAFEEWPVDQSSPSRAVH
jgi:hypothetical protein